MAKKIRLHGSKINQGLLAAPKGAVLTHAWFQTQGISPRHANYYVSSGWLRRFGKGAFALKSTTPDWPGAVLGLQQKAGSSPHPGGRTALELSGLAHFLTLGDKAPVYLFGRQGDRLPRWFRQLPSTRRVRFVTSNFLPAGVGLREHRAGDFTLQLSAPERAILEVLFQQTGDAADYEATRLLFEGLGSLRPTVAQTLLEQCSSVKVKRLFLHFGALLQHAWMKRLDLSKVSLGHGKRVLVRGGRLDPKYLITVPASAEIPADAP